MAFIQVDGRTVEYLREGAGETVLLVSPNFWPLDAWRLSGFPELRGAYDVVTYNNRGYGQSAATPTAYTVYSLADDALALLEALGVAQAHVIGFAYGAQVAVKMALRAPARVKTLVLAASGAGAAKDPSGQSAERMRALLAREGYRAHIRDHALNDDFAFYPEIYRDHHERAVALADAVWEHAATEDEYLKHVQARAGFRTIDDVETLQQPTLVLVGDEDFASRGDTTPVEFARVLAERMPRAELALVPRTRHMLFWERPDECWARVKQFLAAHRD